MAKVRLCLTVLVVVAAAMMLGACSKAATTPTTPTTPAAPATTTTPTTPDTRSAPPIGGGCKYVEVPGIARITSVETAPSGEYHCKDAVKVTFDFIPNDPAAASSFRFPKWPGTFTVGAGMNPPRAWVLERGLTVGSEHACIRSEITAGPCTPVGFRLTDINMEGWDKYCWEK